jgi:hypothetical protein
VAAVALLIALGTRLLGAPAGVLAGLLLAISVHHVDHSQEARPYAVSVAWTVGGYAALFGYLATRRAWRLGAAVACMAMALYTSHLALLHVGVAAGVAMLDIIGAARAARRRGAPIASIAPDRIAPWLLAGGVLAILYAPQIPNLLGFLAGSGAAPNHVLDLRPAVLRAILDRWVSGPPWVTVLFAAAGAAGVARMLQRRDAAGAGVVAWLAAPFLLFAIVPFSKYFDLRFLLPSLPAFCLVVAAGADAAAGAVARGLGAEQRWARAAALAAFAAVAFVPAQALYERLRVAEKRCGDIVLDRALFTANDRLCADHLLLSTIEVEHQFVLRKLGSYGTPPPAALDRLVGRYALDDGREIEITRGAGSLVARIGSRFPFTLVARSETEYASRIDARRITFERGPDGRAVALVLGSAQGDRRALRIGAPDGSGPGRNPPAEAPANR